MRQSETFHNTEQNEFIEKAYKKAVEVIERDRIKTTEFTDLYGPDTIARDNEYITERKKKFETPMNSEEQKQLKLAIIFEAILHEHGEQSDWFGEAAFTIKTSLFDDIANGVDEIVEFEEEETSPSYLALAVDATYSKFSGQKLRRIKEEIDRGVLAQIKYAVVEKTGFRGELKKVPRVVIGVSAGTVINLAELWISKGNDKMFANHPVQMQILEEVLMQAKYFAKYAESQGQPDIARKYQKMQFVIDGVITKKKTQKGFHDNGKRDDVFISLEVALRNIMQS